MTTHLVALNHTKLLSYIFTGLQHGLQWTEIKGLTERHSFQRL